MIFLLGIRLRSMCAFGNRGNGFPESVDDAEVNLGYRKCQGVGCQSLEEFG